MKKPNVPIQLGSHIDPSDPPFCCGRPMEYVGDGIRECTCGCYLWTTNRVVDRLQKCSKHS